MSKFLADKGLMLRNFLEAEGVQLYGQSAWQSVRCYNRSAHAHGDRNRSASVNLLTGRYKCHGCGTAGDVYDLNQHLTPEQVNAKYHGSHTVGQQTIGCSHGPCQELKECKYL